MPDAIEAPFIIRRGDFHYLFASFDFCCRGADSTYYTVVGRAAKAEGPYVDREGRSMLKGGGTVILRADRGAGDRFVGPGHCAVLQDSDRDYIVHHAYDTQRDGVPTLRIHPLRSEEHTSELQSLMRISSAVIFLKKNIYQTLTTHNQET